jgi:hypothetical protein
MDYDPDSAERASASIRRVSGYMRQAEMFNNTETTAGRRMALTNSYAALRELNDLIDELEDGEDLQDEQDS